MNVRRWVHVSVTTIAIGAATMAATPAVAGAQPGPACRAGACQGPGGPGGFDRPGGPGGPGRPGGPGGPRWDAPPPPPGDLAWRGIDQGRFDHQPFTYRGSWVTPVFNPDFRNWGFWFFGLWIPL